MIDRTTRATAGESKLEAASEPDCNENRSAQPMQKIRAAIAGCTLALILAGGGATVATAQDHDNHHYVKHEEWRKGVKIHDEDWQRGERVAEWKKYRLHEPPSGYEWRLIDGNYVLANVSTGVISMTVVAK